MLCGWEIPFLSQNRDRLGIEYEIGLIIIVIMLNIIMLNVIMLNRLNTTCLGLNSGTSASILLLKRSVLELTCQNSIHDKE